jgi:hypothetical protein
MSNIGSKSFLNAESLTDLKTLLAFELVFREELKSLLLINFLKDAKILNLWNMQEE